MGKIIESFYAASESLKGILNASIGSHEELIADLIYRLEIVSDFETLFTENESVKVWAEVNYDLFSALYLCLNGLYRNAFISIRSASELGLGYLYFTDFNYHYLKWKNNKFDLTWASISNESDGILSNNYLKTFDFADTDYSALIEDYKNVYRYCSEYVHGKYEFMHTSSTSKVVYTETSLISFIEQFKKLTDALFSLLIIRFREKVKELEEAKFIYLQDVSKKYKLTHLIAEYGK